MVGVSILVNGFGMVCAIYDCSSLQFVFMGTTKANMKHKAPNQSAANGLSAIRSSDAGIRKRTVRSTAAAKAVAGMCSKGYSAGGGAGPRQPARTADGE